jgi:hypothetical protein
LWLVLRREANTCIDCRLISINNVQLAGFVQLGLFKVVINSYLYTTHALSPMGCSGI